MLGLVEQVSLTLNQIQYHRLLLSLLLSKFKMRRRDLNVFFSCVGSSEKYEVANIRLAPTKKEIQENVEFKIGDLVDLRRQQNGRGPVWIAATVSAIKGDFYVCDFALDAEAQLTKDVVDASDLRSSNPNGPFSISNLFRTTIELPPELHDFCRTRPDEHKDLQRACEAISVKYDNGNFT